MPDDTLPADTLLTPDQVAARLNIKLRLAYTMLAPGGQLHHLRIDLGRKSVRVDPARLEEYLAAGGASNVAR